MPSDLLSGILGFLIGALVGHRLAMWRDDRREFNRVAAPIDQHLLEIEEQIHAGQLRRKLDPDLVSTIKPYLSERERRKLRNLMEEYLRAVELAHPPISEQAYEGSAPNPEKYPQLARSAAKLRGILKVR